MSGELKPHKVTMMEWAFLGVVHDSGKKGISVSELADIIGVEVSHITNMTIKLQKRGLVGKVPHKQDMRIKLLLTTKKGDEFVQATETQLRASMKKWLKPIDKLAFLGYIKTLYEISKLK